MRNEVTDEIDELLRICPAGTRIEIGVYWGATLSRISQHPGETIGVDSFQGMPGPGEHDFNDGLCRYPKGRLAISKDQVQRSSSATLIQGYVPDVLKLVPDGPFAFAHLDIDHYQPTHAALDWLFDRMLPCGILCCDDWFEGRDFLAAKAIAEFAQRKPLAGSGGRKAWWVF